MEFTSFGEVLSRGELFLLDRLVQPLQEEEQTHCEWNQTPGKEQDTNRLSPEYENKWKWKEKHWDTNVMQENKWKLQEMSTQLLGYLSSRGSFFH